MHAMVETLRKEKASHDQGIERLTLRELREKVRRQTQAEAGPRATHPDYLNEFVLLLRIGSAMFHA